MQKYIIAIIFDDDKMDIDPKIIIDEIMLGFEWAEPEHKNIKAFAHKIE